MILLKIPIFLLFSQPLSISLENLREFSTGYYKDRWTREICSSKMNEGERKRKRERERERETGERPWVTHDKYGSEML
jgi:hypothetical protein